METRGIALGNRDHSGRIALYLRRIQQSNPQVESQGRSAWCPQRARQIARADRLLASSRHRTQSQYLCRRDQELASTEIHPAVDTQGHTYGALVDFVRAPDI